MKYFTPDLYVRMQRDDDDELDALHAEWEEAVSRYERRLQKIRHELPRSLRCLLDDVYLHDADVVSLARNGGRFLIVLQLDAPATELVILNYKLAEEPVIQTGVLPPEHCSSHVEWMYDEIDIVPRKKQYSHEILLSNGWHVQLRFREIQVIVAHGLLQPASAAERVAPRTVAQPA